MTYGEILKIATDNVNAEDIAKLLLQKYWEAHGHKGQISELEEYPKVLERETVIIKKAIEDIGESANGYVNKLEYGKYHTGKYCIYRTY